MKIKKILAGATLALLGLCNGFAQTKESVKNGSILHCWCWSFKTIEKNLPKIKEAGWSAVQTSPANTCLEGDYGGLEFMSEDLNGKWYYHYQPTDWKIGNYQLGTRDDFISMCKKADELGIAVIVDVLPNHTTPRLDKVSPEFYEAVGGKDKMFHKGNERGISNYSDRLECTTYQMGGLPDVNTENPLFQAYFMKYMNDLIDSGADGFRFDTAKHIGLPDDPKDPYSKENNFWPIFTGLQPINGEMLHNKDNLFIYGEVLQGGNSREGAYGKYMGVTASSYGRIVRDAIKNGKMSAKGLLDWKNDAGPDKIITWVESHDTYANQGESAALLNYQIRCGYALIAARKGGTPLFFNRPKGKEGVQFPGASKIGDSGNDEFFNKEVIEVNKFRTAFAGTEEELIQGSDTGVLCIKRDNRGVVIINSKARGSGTVNLDINLADGVYKDRAHNIKFNVKNGKLSGKIKAKTVAVIY